MKYQAINIDFDFKNEKIFSQIPHDDSAFTAVYKYVRVHYSSIFKDSDIAYLSTANIDQKSFYRIVFVSKRGKF